MSEYSYKNSGIQWLGEIPTHWKPMKLKKLIKLIPSNVDKRTEDDETPVKLCNYVDVYYNDVIDLSIEFMSATANDTELKRFQLIESDVIITKDSEDPNDIAVPAYVMETEDKLLCGYHLSILRNNSHELNNRFLFWALKDEKIVSQLHREATGITRWAIGSKHIKNSTIALPPPEEQKAIADYLEKACAKIDRVLELKKIQLSQIDEFFKSRMFEILKGTDISDIEFSTSEFEWISKIPSTWEVFRLKHISSKINSGVTPKGGADVYVDEGVPMVRSQNITFERLDIENAVKIPEAVHNSMSNSKLRRGDVLLNITGASLGRCNFFDDDIEANVNQHVCIIRPRFQILTKFLFYLLNSEIGQAQIFSGFKGSGREGLNFEAIKNFRLPVPDTKAQEKIVERLDKIADSVKKQKNLIDLQITRLSNYRASLIHECVTGKKKVFEGDPESLKAEAV